MLASVELPNRVENDDDTSSVMRNQPSFGIISRSQETYDPMYTGSSDFPNVSESNRTIPISESLSYWMPLPREY